MSKEIRTALMCAVFCQLPLSSAVSAQGAAAGMVVAGTVDAAAQSIRDNANAVIQQLEQSFAISSFRARQDIAFLVAEIDHVAERQRGRLFRDLDRQERQLFVDANNLLIEARRHAGTTLAEAEKVVQTVESGIARLPFADRSPRVLRASPNYLLGRSAGAPVTIKVEGSQLGFGPATLKAGGQACAQSAQTEVALTFQCPASLFQAAGEPRTVTADLQLVMPRSLWGRLLFRKPGRKAYKIQTVVVPNRMGSYSIEGAFRVSDRIANQRTGLIDAANPHCAGERTHGPFRFTPANGFQIDPESVRLGSVRGSNRQASVLGPNDVTSAGFYYNMKLKNGGDCVKVLGRIVSYDARAWHSQNVHWTDVRTEETERPLELPAGELRWGEDVALPLPQNVSWFRLSINQIDGEKRVVTDRSETNDWFSVDMDAERRTLVIRPRQLSQALGGE